MYSIHRWQIAILEDRDCKPFKACLSCLSARLVYLAFILALIITGGERDVSGELLKTVEILRANGSYWCSLPNLTYEAVGHSQSGLVTCGGGFVSDSRRSCSTFSSGQWETSHQLQHNRVGHSSWMSDHGLVLIGGYDFDDSDTGTTTEILNDNGQSSLAFNLKRQTL